MRVKKKGLFIVGCLLVLSVASIYLFLPGNWDVSVVRVVKCNSSAAFRTVANPAKWKNWWPEDTVRGFGYRIERQEYPEIGIVLTGEQPIPGAIAILRLPARDSSAILWKMHFSAGIDPIVRIKEYRRSREWQKRVGLVLDSLAMFLERPGNIYKMVVNMRMSTDSSLIMTELPTVSYPTTAEIYGQIHGMRNFLRKKGIRETDPPMLHVVKLNDSSFRNMIAIPIDQTFQAEGAYTNRRFVPWKVMVGEVRGGRMRAEEGMTELQRYISDYQYTVMAIPFESLVTERDQEPDSSRWVTQVVVPVP